MSKFLSLALVLSVSCSAPNDAKLGASGEFCHEDNDCHIDLICNRGLCGDPQAENNGRNNGANNGFLNNGFVNNGQNNGFVNNGQNNGFVNNGQNNGFVNNGQNNGANNGENNGFMNNGVEPIPSCDDVCSHIEDCVGEGNVEDCYRECPDGTRDWTDNERLERFGCILDLECDEIFEEEGLDECLGEDGGGDDHPGDFGDLVCQALSETAERLCDDDLGRLLDRCRQFSDEELEEALDCTEERTCREFIGCVIDRLSN
jgi:hypothetical protein